MASSTLIVTVPATNYSLLTVGEMRSAVGAVDGSLDSELNELSSQVNEALADVCNMRRAGISPLTLRQETYTELFRASPERQTDAGNAGGMTPPNYAAMSPNLILSRRPVSSIASVTEGDTLLAATDYELDSAAGIIRRLSGDSMSHWCSSKISVVYVAGWLTVPGALKRAAQQLLNAYYSDSKRNPLVLREKVEGLGETWYSPGSGGDIPPDVMEMLERGGFVNVRI
ncbi:hypothetical protein UFOVP1299_55 [uncultured Caudovirales phage]|uniref:Phage gp6-like head-tail connector protein n=1 Tax=uncultured Caudovirales phage TaxID=2100421 RepID=A0A6J5RFQ6_9CAUD|nr:hypothetical protein UFOVP1299_55 [uncultured Caudovirales phage]